MIPDDQTPLYVVRAKDVGFHFIRIVDRVKGNLSVIFLHFKIYT